MLHGHGHSQAGGSRGKKDVRQQLGKEVPVLKGQLAPVLRQYRRFAACKTRGGQSTARLRSTVFKEARESTLYTNHVPSVLN